MVARKSSLPPPNAPPPPPPIQMPQQPDHHGYSSYIPATVTSGAQREEDSPYRDMGNPWADETLPAPASRTEHPEILRPGGAKATTKSEIPDVMQPGWSGQNTPRSSLDSDRSKDFWESSDDEEEESKNKKDIPPKQTEPQRPAATESTEDLVIPSPLQIRRKPVGSSPLQPPNPPAESSPPNPAFASNNPFRRGSSEKSPGPQSPIELLSSWGPRVKGKGKEADMPPSTESARLISHNTGVSDHPIYNASQAHHPSDFWQPPPTQRPPIPQSPPPPIPVPQISSPFSEQPPLIPVSPKNEADGNPWASRSNLPSTPSPIPFAPYQKQSTHSTDDLLDRGPKAEGRISLGDELRVLPNAAQPSTSQTSLLDVGPSPSIQPPVSQASRHTEEAYAPPQGPPPSHIASIHSQATSPPPPTKPPRPAVVVKPLSQAELAEIQEQRNETYQIKHFNWFDHRSGKLRTSSMLTQNKNGPCPLLALVNALILGMKDVSQAALDDALRSREQVSLGLIIETLMDELISSGVHLDGELPDVDELNKFLMKLRTGMNMNPRFIQPQGPPPNLMDARNSMLNVPAPQARDQPGNFEPTQDIRLYSAFGIKTVHGWLPEPRSEELKAFSRSAQNYEDAQVVQFGEEELDYKLSRGGLTAQEQQLWEDIVSIKNFFRLHPTQLTPYGLMCIQQSMQPGSFAILFRNDHFSTIYKHPRDGKLYTLISDAGYADRDEIIWESLVDISGQHSEFFSGDFQSVSHHNVESSRRTSNHLTVESSAPEPLSPQQQQEQHDADFAMALQLQEEEDQRQRQQRNNRSSSGSGPNSRESAPAPAARRGQGIPIPLRSNNAGTENRPLIPPRQQRPSMPAVNRPSDALDADAPPTYEEAAKGKPYNPPLGSPLHPQSSASAEPSPHNSTSHVNIADTMASSSNDNMVPALRRPERRQSAYSENYERQGLNPRSSSGRFELGMSPAYNERNSRMPGSYYHSGQGGHGQGFSGGSVSNTGNRRRNDDGDCTVM